MNESLLYLASRSPRRAELLRQIGVPFRILEAPIDERRRAGESVAEFVARMALEKARAGRGLLDSPRGSLVLGADTVVVLADRVLGKPGDEIEAAEMLLALSGREHQVHTAVAVVGPGGEECRTSISRVWFQPLSRAQVEAYVATREPMDKAGAYAIQGLAAIFVTRLEGSYSGVMGLPLFETADLLAAAGRPLI